MREIKFRAWATPEGYPEDHCMLYVGDDKGTTHNLDCCNYLIQGQPVTLMQYTGLKDKNGVEIYEGDLRQWSFEGIERIYEVYYDDFHAAFKCKLVKYSDKYDPSIDEFERDFHKRMIRENACSDVICDRWSKAIGNIYTDKELLK